MNLKMIALCSTGDTYKKSTFYYQGIGMRIAFLTKSKSLCGKHLIVGKSREKHHTIE